jgi:hypothetical protein
MISMPMVCSVQIMHLSCTDINTICKWTKTKFHTTHETYEFHWVRPQLFMSLWYVQCKPCTYLESRLALSANGPNMARRKLSTYLGPTLTRSQNRSKRDSTRPMSTRSSIGCLQYYFQAYGTFDANRAPIVHHE